MEDIRRFKEGGKNTIEFASKFVLWSPFIALIIYIIYLLVGLMTSKKMTFTEATIFSMKKIFQLLYVILKPILFILSKVVQIAKYIFGDAWNSKNRIRSAIFTLAALIVLTGIGIIFIPRLSTGFTIAQHTLMMTWYGRIFIGLSSILALVLLILFIQSFNLDMHKQTDPTNIFPSDKPYEKQSAYLFNRSRIYLTVIIGVIIFLAVLSGILYYMFYDKGDAYTGSYMLLGISTVIVLAILHIVFLRTGVYKNLMKNSVVRLIYHSIFLLPCWFLDIIDYLSKEFQHTPKSVYYILGIEILLIILWVLMPILKNYIYTATLGSGIYDMKSLEITGLKTESISKNKKISNLKKIDNSGPGGISYLQMTNSFWKKALLVGDDEKKIKQLIIESLKKYRVDLTKNKNEVDKIYNKFKLNWRKIGILKQDKMVIAEKITKLEKQLGSNVGKLKSVILQDKPININKIRYIGDHKNMRTYGDKIKGGFFPPNYNYALSCWIYLNSDGPNFNPNSFKTLIDYSNKPRILFNPTRNELAVLIKKPNKDVKKFILKNIKLQKWINLVINYDGGVLDIFKDGKLVVSEPGLIPYMKSDIVKIGDNNGLNGGICNVVYYNTHISKTRIQTIYNLLKNNNPPVV